MTDEPTTREALRGKYQHAKMPGKYEGNSHRLAAAYVHEITLNGFADEQVGTVEYGPGWYALVRFDTAAQRDVSWLMDDEHVLVDPPTAAIVHEDDHGFVNVTFYIYENEAESDFGKAETKYANIDAMYPDDEGDDGG